MSHIVDPMLVEKLLCDNPWRIRDNFVNPPTKFIVNQCYMHPNPQIGIYSFKFNIQDKKIIIISFSNRQAPQYETSAAN
jgi:hypothetical protein